MKILIISYVFPPCATGAAPVMYNFCKNLPKRCYNVITTKKEFCVRKGIYDKDYDLDCNAIRLPVRTARMLDVIIFSLLAVLKGLSASKKERIDCILAVQPYFGDALAAYILHRLIKKPFVIFMHDLFSEVKKRARAYRLWVILERKIFASASRILVMNEEYRRHYFKRGIRNITIFPPTIDLENYASHGTVSRTFHIPQGKLKIVCTGSMYALQESAALTFLEAVKNVSGVQVLFTNPNKKGYLKDVSVGFLSKKDTIALQKNADVLLLPLSSNSPYPEEVKCCIPARTLEYLAAGKAILAVVPKGSFLESFVKKYEVGLTSNESVEEITNAINELKDEKKRNRFSQNALRTARLFDAKIWTKKLCSLLDDIVFNRE